MYFSLYFMGRQQPGSAGRSESACMCQVCSSREDPAPGVAMGWSPQGRAVRIPLEQQVLPSLAQAELGSQMQELQLLLLPAPCGAAVNVLMAHSLS